jgi:hypothetical protein
MSVEGARMGGPCPQSQRWGCRSAAATSETTYARRPQSAPPDSWGSPGRRACPEKLRASGSQNRTPARVCTSVYLRLLGKSRVALGIQMANRLF